MLMKQKAVASFMFYADGVNSEIKEMARL